MKEKNNKTLKQARKSKIIIIIKLSWTTLVGTNLEASRPHLVIASQPLYRTRYE
jgi:hypothetical protein